MTNLPLHHRSELVAVDNHAAVVTIVLDFAGDHLVLHALCGILALNRRNNVWGNSKPEK